VLPFGVTIPATVPQESEIPKGFMNNLVYISRLAANEIFSPSKKYFVNWVGLRTYQHPGYSFMKQAASVMETQISWRCAEGNCCVGLVWNPDGRNSDQF
jgi:hypothetical protein